MATLDLININKIYPNGVQAVFDFNLHIEDEEFVVFVGPSGCGKSTTLRMVAGLEEITEGELYIDGRIVNSIEPKDRDIAMVFQSYALYPHMTVAQNMAYPLRILPQNITYQFEIDFLNHKIEEQNAIKAELKEKLPAEAYAKKAEAIDKNIEAANNRINECDAAIARGETSYVAKLSPEMRKFKVMQVAEMLNITEYLDRKPKNLSGGQRQRVAIGRAMVRDSKVFLMDEPLSNLDAKLRNQMRAEIILLRKKIDTTFIYVTHDQTEAMTLGDRIVIMKDGYIQQVGTPTQVFEEPENLFVAEFIGAPKMNTFNCKLIKSAEGYFVRPFDSTIKVDGKKGERLQALNIKPQEIILGVRPEHITLAEEGAKDAFPVTIEVNEMMGSELHLHVITDDETRLIVRIPTIDLDDETRESMVFGAKMWVTFTGKVMHFFDAETKHNLLTTEEIEEV